MLGDVTRSREFRGVSTVRSNDFVVARPLRCPGGSPKRQNVSATIDRPTEGGPGDVADIRGQGPDTCLTMSCLVAGPAVHFV